MSSTNVERLDAALTRFQAHPLISKFREFLVEASDEELFRIDPTRLAERWTVRRRTAVEILLRAVRHEWKSGATIRGVEVLNHPVFRDIFGDARAYRLIRDALVSSNQSRADG